MFGRVPVGSVAQSELKVDSIIDRRFETNDRVWRDRMPWPTRSTSMEHRRHRNNLLVISVLGWCLALLWPAAAALAAEPMSFALTTIGTETQCHGSCPEVIVADGEISNETADQFVTFLSEHLKDSDLRPVVLLQSPGGTVVGAMQLGSAFRKIGAAVIVAALTAEPGSNIAQVTPGSCYSACVYAFLGGKRRVVPPVSRLGIHRMVIDEAVRDPSGAMERQRIYGSSEFVSSLSAYAKLMGADPRMIAYAERISPDAIHIVTAEEIRRWRLGGPRL